MPGDRHRVVILGGGFGGLHAARSLRHAPVEVTLVDRRKFHLFQPLLYEVATGAGHNYFGHDQWAAHAPGLKTVEDATDIRRRILSAFEAAERESDPGRFRAWHARVRRFDVYVRAPYVGAQMIRVRDLRKTYGPLVAVDEISFAVARGESFGLLGPNGAGKTTTIHLLVGALRPDAGTVTVDGTSDPTRPHVRQRLGVAPRSLALYGQLTAEENLAFFGRLYGMDRELGHPRAGGGDLARFQADRDGPAMCLARELRRGVLRAGRPDHLAR